MSDIVKRTSQYIDNLSFDETYEEATVLTVEEDPNGTLKRKVTEDLTSRIYTAGGYTYIAEATPGSLTSVAVWRMSRIDSSGNELYADSNANFDNVADDYVSLTYA